MKNIEQVIKNIEKRGEAIGFEQKSDRKVGVLLATLCTSKPHGRFLELGTGCGLSTVWIAEGMDDMSQLTTVDNDTKVMAVAKEYLAEDERITFVCSSGESVIDGIEKNSIDFIFADTWPGKYHYLEEALALLKVGGMYVIDDMLPQDNWPEGHEEKADALVQCLHQRDDFNIVQLSWATGVIIATKTKQKETNQWNPETYNKHTAFVSQLALPVVDLLDPKPGEKILDAGCGEGALAEEIVRRGAEVIGVDLSAEMVDACRDRWIEAQVCSVTDLPWHEAFDAVFSNATLHWVKEARDAVNSIATVLSPGGRFVCEFGGEGNVYHVVRAMEASFAKHPEFGTFVNPWYFPSPEKYRTLLESEGFRVESIELIPRPTPMEDIGNWFDVFAKGVCADLSDEQFEVFKRECKAYLEDHLKSEAGWFVDYVRLRVRAVKCVEV
ncbi:methyltransferase domain-containing protein [Sulfurovum sp. NBC37-1]|uniref:methyltransferase domain-containing protein n=1 Tax=Sulfurovum sp. (strain NBC37-1) TaxID=387093 RepID=UPI0001587695|nr:methyltransferase domain-containing protein [Sulfurovum sp. NBC37-1]BAF71886.1 hypothetical protein SUN_0928 [Sulfurovum sp. NBC37-1]